MILTGSLRWRLHLQSDLRGKGHGWRVCRGVPVAVLIPTPTSRLLRERFTLYSCSQYAPSQNHEATSPPHLLTRRPADPVYPTQTEGGDRQSRCLSRTPPVRLRSIQNGYRSRATQAQTCRSSHGCSYFAGRPQRRWVAFRVLHIIWQVTARKVAYYRILLRTL